jgi:hypothetical protein
MRLGRRLSRVGSLMATLALMSGAIGIRAGTINSVWNGGTGNWSVPTDWTPHAVPNNGGGSVYNVTIDSGGSDLVSLDIHATIASLVLGGTSGSSTLQNLLGKAESFEVTGATTINRTGVLTFGNSSALKFDGGLTAGGQFNLNGATATIGGSGTWKSGSSADISGGSTLTVNGTLTNSSASFYTGYPNGGGNTLTVNGGFTNSGSFYMYGSTFSGTGDTLKVTGTLTNNAGAFLNLQDNSADVANVGTLSNSGTVYVGKGTTLNLTSQANGITDVPAGSTLTVAGTLKAGTANGLAKLGSVEGTLNLENGQTTGDAPGSGTLTVASGGSLILSNSGTTLSVTGALSDSGSVTVESGSTLSLTKGMSNLAGTLNLQNGKTTSVTPSGGTLTLASTSTLEVSGASGLTVNGNLTNKTTRFYTGYPNGGGNTLTVNGGFTNSGTVYMYGNTFGGVGDTLKVTGTLTNSSGATLDLVANSKDVANVGALSNSGTVYINGGTALNVTGTGLKFTQTAGTTTVDGTLTANGGITFSGGSAFGSGTITGKVTSSGTIIAPGDSSTATGILTDKGAYTQNSAGVLDINIGGTTAGTQFDRLTISGAASLNGALNVAEINGFTPTVGQTFDIINFASEAGTFSYCNGHSGGTTCTINSTEHFLVEYNVTNVTLKVVAGASTVTPGSISGATGWASSAQAANQTPEPSTLLMLGSGLLLLAHYARSRAAGKGQS